MVWFPFSLHFSVRVACHRADSSTFCSAAWSASFNARLWSQLGGLNEANPYRRADLPQQ
jgi:hypothetical protein